LKIVGNDGKLLENDEICWKMIKIVEMMKMIKIALWFKTNERLLTIYFLTKNYTFKHFKTFCEEIFSKSSNFNEI